MHILQAMQRVKAFEWASIVALVLATFVPFLLSSQEVRAAQITAREVTISDSSFSATSVEHAFSFNLPTAGQVESIEIEYCQEAVPLATCTAPGSGFTAAGATYTSQGSWSGATAFAVDGTGANDCLAGATKVCLERTDTTSESGAKTLTIDGIVNPSNEQTVFVRIYTYLDNDWNSADLVDTGTVAFATVNELILTARVAETLDFCVGDTDGATNSDCTDITGTTVDLDVLDTGSVNESSVDGAVGDRNGYVMIRSNASNGVDIDYSGNTLTSGSNTIAANNDAEDALVAGTAGWGMDVTTVDITNGTTNNITAGLDANFNDATDGTVYWGSTSPSVFDDLATTSTVVDDELIVLDFEATAGITTATGVYTTTIMFVGTPNY